jgi:cellulose synthase/poly-beta-1,6-N-acetylglucosamine synthase-like glycosyltransferase
LAYRNGGGAVRDRSRESGWSAAAARPPFAHYRATGATGLPRNRGLSRSRLPRCPEIDCIRHLLPPGELALAELRAIEADIGADRILIAAGAIGEETYTLALAAWLDVAFDPLSDKPRERCPIPDARLIEAAVTGLLPLLIDNEVNFVVVPRLVDSRRLVAAVRGSAELARRIRLTSSSRLLSFVARHGAVAIEYQAAEALRSAHPEFSAGSARVRRPYAPVLLAATAIAALLAAVVPNSALLAAEAALALVFLAWTGLRLFGLLSERLLRRHPHAVADEWLPVYTIVVALYREAAALRGLVAALRALNYPAEKLDIKLVLEPDDQETRDALARLDLGPCFEVIVAPRLGPRTKPKALNAALPFARGSFVAVYDAEDRPEPDQLRLALEAFLAGGARLGCVQSRLTIDNSADSWLARLFTAEYAGLFDVFLPGLAAWRLPLPLGGSSNHFRTALLRKIGAWDPYNVTEDADLGMRIARCGYRTTVIASTTYEEAPASFGPWLRQRSRWFKGWMQTWLVHLRSPRRLVRELGLAGFVVFQLLVGGTVLAALVHSIFAAALLAQIAWPILHESAAGAMLGLHVPVLLVGYLVSATLGLVGLVRRRLFGCIWALLLMPLYWLLLSLAAWRALYQLVRDPYRWEKTEHGLARTSRLAEQRAEQAPVYPA